MKNILASTACLLLFGAGAQAATLSLSGTITDTCVINQITPTAYTTLDIAAGGTATVAQTDVTCNHNLGYKLRASSANAGLLVNGSSPGNSAAYTLKIFGTGTQGHKSLTVAAQDLVNTGALSSPVTNELRSVEVVVTAAAVPWSGTYSDIVTVTLTTL